MGNRAIIKPEGKNIGVYLHWNGGFDSVTAFLKYCELKGYRGFDDSYGMARFCQVVGNFFGGGLSLGVIANVEETDEEAMYIDNGIYIVKHWTPIRHIGDFEKEGYDLEGMLKEIDSRQPESEQLGDFLDAVEKPISEIKIGDTVFVQNISGNYEKHKVIGIGEDKIVNGTNVLGVPYVDKWNNGPDNINNYICTKTRVSI